MSKEPLPSPAVHPPGRRGSGERLLAEDAAAVPPSHIASFVEMQPAQPRTLDVVRGFVIRSLRVRRSDCALLSWAPFYTWEECRADALAGVTVGTMLVPQAMAYAILAGLPAQYGLYSSIFPSFVYGLLTTCAAIAPGPVAPFSILLESQLRGLPAAGVPFSDAWVGTALRVSGLVGVIQLCLGLLRFGAVASLLSWPVMAGFTSSAALLIIASQLTTLLGLPSAPSSDSFFVRVIKVCGVLPQTSVRTLLLSAVCIGLLLLAKMRMPVLPRRCGGGGGSSCCRNKAREEAGGGAANLAQGSRGACGRRCSSGISSRGGGGCGSQCFRPGQLIIPKAVPMPLLLVLFGVLFSWVFDMQAAGFTVVGTIPSSLPVPTAPALPASTAELLQMLPAALLLSLVSYVQTVSLALTFGRRAGTTTNPNTELLALGVTSLIGTSFSSYAVSGSITRTALQAASGARTPASIMFCGAFMLVATLSLGRLFYYLPTAILGAIIVLSATSMIDTREALTLWRWRSADFLQFAVTGVVVLAVDIQTGILAGVGTSLVLLTFSS